MNRILYKAILLGIILMFILAPFAGFAPLLLAILVASVYWFLTSIVNILVFGEKNTANYEKEAVGKD